MRKQNFGLIYPLILTKSLIPLFIKDKVRLVFDSFPKIKIVYPETIIKPTHPDAWKTISHYGLRTCDLVFQWHAETDYEKDVKIPGMGLFQFWYLVGAYQVDIDDASTLMGLIPDILVPLRGHLDKFLQHKQVPLTPAEIITYLKMAGFQSI